MIRYSAQQKTFLTKMIFGVVCVALVLFGAVSFSSAQFNPVINYQGKLTDATGVAVTDGTYEIEFNLYTQAVGGVAIWTETLDGADEVQVTNGLFSVMLGSTTPLTTVDFNQTLYLGVTVEADSEMSPRKVLGAVPAAFEAENAQTLDGIATSSFLRSDQADTATGLLTFSNGFISSASSTISNLTTLTASTTDLAIEGRLYDSNNSAGTSGYVLQSTGTGQQWVATSSLGFGTSNFSTTQIDTYSELNAIVADVTLTHNGLIDTSAELLAIVGDETGTGNLVFSASPTFTGTVVFPSAITLGSNTLTRSGAHNLTLTTTGATNITFPISGTLYGTAASSITSAQLLSSLSDETGTGLAVFATSPTFTTQLTSPMIVGGTAASSNLLLKSTSGVGTSDYIGFLVGNNGAT